MAVGQVNGVFIFNGAPQNGAVAKLWERAGFYTAVDSGDTVQDNPLTATAVVVNVVAGGTFAADEIIRIETEHMYIISIAVNALTVQRGYDNTDPVQHVQTTAIYDLTQDDPVQDDAEPAAGYQQGATITTAVAYGGDGAYRWIDVPDGEYFVSCFYDSHRAWLHHQVESRFTASQVLKIAGDMMYRGTDAIERLPIGTAGQVPTSVGGLIAWATPSGEVTVDEQILTANGNWNKPALKHFAIIEVIGGGGGGGGGNGASGGGGGGRNIKIIDIDSLGDPEAIVVGAGGAGGAAGADGVAGGTSSFGTHVEATGGNKGLTAARGNGGGGGGAGPTTFRAAINMLGAGCLGAGEPSTGAGFGLNGLAAEFGGASGAMGATQNGDSGHSGGSSAWGGAGGGGGGFAVAQTNGGAGGLSGAAAAGGGGAGGAAPGGVGSAGAAGNNVICGAGGGGGGGFNGGTGGAGGAGGIAGGGGGGGGGGTVASGAGGAGARGEVRVWSF